MKQLDQLLAQYKGKGVLVDTNLLLLYFVGLYDRGRVPKFKRTMKFAVEDFDTLLGFFRFFDKVITTPNVLTEVSNLAGQLPDDLKQAFYFLFAQQLAFFEEHYLTSAALSSTAHFPKLGLSDCGIMELSRNQYLVLTDDFRLAGHLESQGIDVINFNHVRTMNWR
jgi:rRNA-processing protein FCF1